MMSLIAGKTWIIPAVLALVATLIFGGMIQYVRNAEKNRVIIELQEKQKQRRDKIDEGIRSAPTNVDDSLHYLRDR